MQRVQNVALIACLAIRFFQIFIALAAGFRLTANNYCAGLSVSIQKKVVFRTGA